MNELRLDPSPTWQDLGISVAWIEEKAIWMRRESGSPGAIDGYFCCAGRLMRLCAYDYYLLGPMFFHAVIGLEAMLRVHYKTDLKTPFRKMLEQGVAEGIFHDGIFSDIRPFDEIFRKRIGKGQKSRAEALAILLPDQRNQYMHGTYLLHPDYLHLAIQIREMVDVLTMPSHERRIGKNEE